MADAVDSRVTWDTDSVVLALASKFLFLCINRHKSQEMTSK